MRLQDIINKSDSRSKEKASHDGLAARLYKVENNKILYTVTSSTGNKQYIVTIQLLGLTGNKLKSLKSALNGNIKISCSCPAFLFHGYKYISWKASSGIDREDRSPDKTNPNKKGMACKHILVALNQIKSDYGKIHDMIKAQIPKGKDKPQPTDIKDNAKSDSPTELDIKIVTDFKDAVSKLYKDYTKFLDSDHLDSDTFANSKFYDKVDPSRILNNLSKPVAKSLNGKFIGKLKSLNDILKLIDQKKNGFNVLLDSDIKALTNKLNATIHTAMESYINNIILNLIYS
jgi:hypothetical protein